MKLHLPLLATSIWLGLTGIALTADRPAAAGAQTPEPPASAAPSDGWFDGGWRPRWLAERFGGGAKETREGSVELASGEETLPPLGPLGETAADGSYYIVDGVASPLPAYTDIPIPRDGGYDGYHAGGSSIVTGQPYQWHVMPQGLIYRTYLAGEKEPRLRSFWYNERGRNLWDLTLGGSVGLLRYGTQGSVRPEGWQIGVEGAGIVRLDVDQERDVDSDDFRGGIPITWGDSIYQVKFAYYHLSSHLGDEYLIKHPTYDRLNYSRDVFVWGHSVYPTDDFRVYGEIGYAFVYDVGKPWEFQFGVDWAPGNATGKRGAPFAAVNAHLREELNYGGNIVLQTGWAWRGSPASGLFRVGVEYYNGKDDQFSFYQDSVEKIGGGIWYDF